MTTKDIRSFTWTNRFSLVQFVSVFAACSLGCTTNPPDPAPISSATSAPPSPPPAVAAGPEELALVAPLVVGSKLGTFEITKISAIHKGILEIICRKDQAHVRLSIALLSDNGPAPPAQADKYAVFYSVRSGDPAEGERLAKSLAEIVGKHSDVPVPKGLTEFVPAGIPM